MPYCSEACQTADLEKHSTLCTKLPFFTDRTRPSLSHIRCIYFPVAEVQPRFVWLKLHGDPQNMNIDREDLKRYISGCPSGGDMTFDCFRALNRPQNCSITIQHDNNFLGNKQPPNRSVQTLLGEQVASRLRGPLLAHAYKYRIGDGAAEWEAEDRELGVKPLIPLDLRIVALPPILSFLKWRATSTDGYELEVDRERVG
ncbi:Nn.00g004080.m01.CDS01 [Neocucurbitaria sp. VM-36]